MKIIKEIKKELLVALLERYGDKKVHECLQEIDTAFGILLREQKKEFKKNIKRIQILADAEQCLETDLALQDLLEKL